jgi:hypothetical protein
MAPQAQSVMAVSLETGPEQLPISPRLASVEPSTAHSDRLRPLEVAQCSLCGIARPLGLLVPDGGQACADIRWYCKDSLSCTQRWTTALSAKSAYVQATPGYLVAGAEEPATDEASAERLDELAEAQPGG